MNRKNSISMYNFSLDSRETKSVLKLGMIKVINKDKNVRVFIFILIITVYLLSIITVYLLSLNMQIVHLKTNFIRSWYVIW